MKNRILHILNTSDKGLLWIGRCFAWLLIPLTVVTLYDVVSRRFGGVGSTGLQEMEWHIHTLLFAFLFAGVMIKDMNVRVDVLRESFSNKIKLHIELWGTLLLAIPYIIAVIYFGIHFTYMAFTQGEGSISSHGLPYRWLIKSAIPIGMCLLLLASINKVLRHCITLLNFAEEHHNNDK